VTSQFWPDTSMGCPEAGKLYSQIIVEGYRIVLESGGKKYAYHTSQENFVLCLQDKP
ncbi:MAG: hypothetical protein HY023_08490, partial [Chloroflexi bacterium]|nr:hypothetical protein [Chloroflexota bacterium]